MKWFAYIKYFAYLAWNWNIPIAWRIIREEIRGEKKYGIQSTGADETATGEADHLFKVGGLVFF